MKLGSVLVAVAIAATLLAFGFAAWYVVFPTPSESLPGPPIAYLPLSGPHTGNSDGLYYYNFTVVGPTRVGSWGEIQIALLTQTGANISSTSPHLNLTVLNGSGEVVASYDFAASVWTMGSSESIWVGQLVALSSPVASPLDHDNLSFNLPSEFTESFGLG